MGSGLTNANFRRGTLNQAVAPNFGLTLDNITSAWVARFTRNASDVAHALDGESRGYSDSSDGGKDGKDGDLHVCFVGWVSG